MYCHQCGKEIPNGSTYCPYCGVSLTSTVGQYQSNTQPYPNTIREQDESNVGFAVLSFFIPIVGIVLYCIWRKEFPKKAKSCLKGFVGSIVLYVVFFCCLISFIIGMASSDGPSHDYDWNQDYYNYDYDYDNEGILSNTRICDIIKEK